MSASMSPSSSKSARLFDLDWLRVLATLAVFVYHTGRFFDTMEPWHIKNSQLTDALTVPMAFGSQFAMLLFFILSGMSTRFALGARPATEFLRRRLLRLLLPLVTVGWFVLCPPQVYIEAVTAQNYNVAPFSGTFWQFVPRYFQGRYGAGGYFPLTGVHLWYLFWLVAFTLVALPLFLYLRSSSGKRAMTALAGFLARPGAIFLLGLPLLLPELLFGPNETFILGWEEGGWVLGTHLVVFVWGFLLASDVRLRGAMERQRWVALALAVFTLIPVALSIEQFVSPHPDSLSYVLLLSLRTVNGWFWLVAILGFGSRHLNFANRTLAYAGEAVLPFYMLHQTVIVVLGYAIRDWPLAIALKYPLLVVVAFAVCMSLYEFLIRRVGWLRFLFGMAPKAPAGGERRGAPASQRA